MSLFSEQLPDEALAKVTTSPEPGNPEPIEREPDYRFTLANERTFLAWIRTALALLAGSIAIIQLIPHFRVPHVREVLGGFLALTSIALTMYSGWRWYAVQRAMRREAALPPSHAVWLLICTIVFVGTIILLLAIGRASGG
ncbi:DUF202 domain-containing protein (plasmid) [Rhizobium sp. CC1099]|uniref:YidH family protein n=1 Tax=Rhizobium sp. CC1099 TaxID=3039160 RepID=UPI0024B0720F|nr:DUF202 domain-containing protein [Rhizobium sp. CC1099]WFU91399.1 DUF202 domain-containing protein [Rhizobium sp. CC1099]